MQPGATASEACGLMRAWGFRDLGLDSSSEQANGYPEKLGLARGTMARLSRHSTWSMLPSETNCETDWLTCTSIWRAGPAALLEGFSTSPIPRRRDGLWAVAHEPYECAAPSSLVKCSRQGKITWTALKP